ncbi:hypothetical protein D477_010266 [Arthrobacter crystallopoietes BAB-32]|uniref:Uncharacterized protein n=1 Tax=Arthrobacter crystallopoietes BAB-32 TaxID=1246476 RepID=N1V7X3_9MICC|nr:hypothetical protein [Arthrobacter crystallopoietes]EMY34328.1 hypothetical protein D477_010266 [Arthrobacter crystallopoietes BAB-32]
MDELFADGFPWWMIWVGFAVFSSVGERFRRGRKRHHRHKVHRQAEARAERERRDSAAAWLDQLRRDTAAVMADHDAVNARWLEYELDVAKLIDYPMMSDVREPLTVEFLRAKRAADGLRPQQAEDISTTERLQEYRDAVRTFEVAFEIAEREARRIKDQHFTGPERQRLNTARRLLTMAVDRAGTPAERQLAYRRARKELDGLLALPPEAVAALERRVAPELPQRPVRHN